MRDDLRQLLEANPQLWDLYTRREEYRSPHLDRHGRFPYAASRWKEIERPVVSEFLVEHGYTVEQIIAKFQIYSQRAASVKDMARPGATPEPKGGEPWRFKSST